VLHFDDDEVAHKIKAGPQVFDALAAYVEAVGLYDAVAVREYATLFNDHEALLPLPQTLRAFHDFAVDVAVVDGLREGGLVVAGFGGGVVAEEADFLIDDFGEDVVDEGEVELLFAELEGEQHHLVFDVQLDGVFVFGLAGADGQDLYFRELADLEGELEERELVGLDGQLRAGPAAVLVQLAVLFLFDLWDRVLLLLGDGELKGGQ
jgi:hypothetical protein